MFRLGLLAALALLFYGIFILRTAFTVDGVTFFTLVDDAMISMRYARNLADGLGLVWNPGESPIEGFSNLGWTLYMALIHVMPLSESKISLLVMATSAILLVGNTYLSFRICKTLAPEATVAPYVAAVMTAFYFPLVYWSLRGLEVGLSVFLVYAAVLLTIARPRTGGLVRSVSIGLLMLLALLVRFDTLLQVTLVLGYLMWVHVNSGAKFKHILPVLSCYLIGIAGIPLFQYLYFGSALPNTYFLKVEGVALHERLIVGIQVFVQYASRDLLAPLIVIVAALIFCHGLRKKAHFLLLAIFLVQCVYSMYVGGDYAEPLSLPAQVDAANRFITQGMLSVIVLFGISMERILDDMGSRSVSTDDGKQPLFRTYKILGVSLAMLVIMSGEPWFQWTARNAPLLGADIWRTRLGVLVGRHTDEDAVIAVHAAGQIPYYARRTTIDLLGKSDAHVARGRPSGPFRPGHNKWDYEHSISGMKPDLVADEWGELAEFMAGHPEYLRLNNGIYVRRDSDRVYLDGLDP